MIDAIKNFLQNKMATFKVSGFNLSLVLTNIQENQLKILDAVQANTDAVNALHASATSLADSVTSTGTAVATMQDQIANDDTAGNAQAVATLSANTQTLNDTAKAVQAAADALRALTAPKQ